MHLWCFLGNYQNQRRRSTLKIETVSFRATYIFACHFPPGYRLLRFRNFSVVCENVCFLHLLHGGLTGKYHYFPFSIVKLGLLLFPTKFDTPWIIGVRPSSPGVKVCVCIWRGMWHLPWACCSPWIGKFNRKLATFGVCRCCKIHCLTCIYTPT